MDNLVSPTTRRGGEVIKKNLRELGLEGLKKIDTSENIKKIAGDPRGTPNVFQNTPQAREREKITILEISKSRFGPNQKDNILIEDQLSRLLFSRTTMERIYTLHLPPMMFLTGDQCR